MSKHITLGIASSPQRRPRRQLACATALLFTLVALLATACALAPSSSLLSPSSLPGVPGPSTLAPTGPAAASISGLWWFMLSLGALIYVGVMAFLLWAVLRRRRRPDAAPPSPQRQQRIIVWGGVVMPSVVVLVVFGATLWTMRALPSPGEGAALTIDVTGFQWWWEVRYGEAGVTTANEIHLPLGQPVDLRLTSADVIHSFWVPQLHGKLDLNPGHVTTLRLTADEPGVYWGQCAEYCGLQHANMRFVVVVEAPEEVERWLAAMQQPAAVPTEPLARQGMDVFLGSNCIFCHRVNGTDATGDLGPDLTHVASRLILGAGATPNNRGSLGGWVADPHSVKPGVLMPPSGLSSEELQALLAYLETLQ